jgi:hypothetical protein
MPPAKGNVQNRIFQNRVLRRLDYPSLNLARVFIGSYKLNWHGWCCFGSLVMISRDVCRPECWTLMRWHGTDQPCGTERMDTERNDLEQKETDGHKPRPLLGPTMQSRHHFKIQVLRSKTLDAFRDAFICVSFQTLYMRFQTLFKRFQTLVHDFFLCLPDFKLSDF